MRFGLFYLPTFASAHGRPPAGLLREIVDQAALAEELGFAGVWLAEHHFHGFGGVMAAPAALGCAIAMRTRRLRIGTAVTLLAYHHPLRLAEDYATLDVLSDGRLDFGVGTGFLRWENEIWDAPLETVRAKFAETLEVVLRVWQEEDVAYQGQFVRFPALTTLPRPLQQPHPPVWLAAITTPETFVLAGQRGYHLMLAPFLHPLPELREKVALYRDALRAAGHDPATREVLAAYHICIAPDRAAARRAAEVGVRSYVTASAEIHARTADRPIPPSFRKQQRSSVDVLGASIDAMIAEHRVIAGTAAEVVDVLASLRDELGLTYVAANVALTGLTPAEQRRAMERLAADVVPHFQSSAAPAS
ncbi:MAG TPA: LLM class flavin-dependent oxidoreductase [Chloroflexota bacterium]|jgi:natural product biosynthesis luciferase-like monooxygenase protein